MKIYEQQCWLIFYAILVTEMRDGLSLDLFKMPLGHSKKVYQANLCLE